MKYWDDKPYNNLNYYFKKRFGTKVYKIPVNGGFTCPNRDGTLDTRGCIFCSAGGSGDFAPNASIPIQKQIALGKEQMSSKLRSVSHPKYIAYFQAFTNTYAPLNTLISKYEAALNEPEIVGISIGTRPDCLASDVIKYLEKKNQETAVFVELGLQTIHEKTAQTIRRGYPLSIFENAVKQLADAGIPIIVHIIIGLPGETNEDMIATIKYLNTLPISGVKLAMLHILKGTDLAEIYLQNKDSCLELYSLEQYCDIITTCIGYLRPDIVVHRITGDGPRQLVIAPLWTLDKRKVLNSIHHTFREKQIYQGMYLEDNIYAD